jgi:aminoglycoside/choline kinase family phosphotransferase
VSEELENLLLERYVQIRILLDEHFDETLFRKSYAIMAAQRASKVIGIFVRLNERDGKPGYLKHIPRIEQYLERVTRHDVLKPLRKWLEEAQILQSES